MSRGWLAAIAAVVSENEVGRSSWIAWPGAEPGNERDERGIAGAPLSLTESPRHDVSATVQASSYRFNSWSPFRPEFWRGTLRGPYLTSFLGPLLVPPIAVMTLTGFVSCQ